MLPDNYIRSGYRQQFLNKFTRNPLHTVHFGGVALGDVSQGLFVQDYTLYFDQGVVYLQYANEVLPLFSKPDVTWLKLTFDVNMTPYVAYVASGVSWLYYYNTVSNMYEHLELEGAGKPCVAIDEPRSVFAANADVILSYVRDDKLTVRYQRDRFLKEYILQDAVGLEVVHSGMTHQLRYDFLLRNKQGE